MIQLAKVSRGEGGDIQPVTMNLVGVDGFPQLRVSFQKLRHVEEHILKTRFRIS